METKGKLNWIILLSISMLVVINSTAQKIIGYFPNYAYNAATYNQIQYNKLTHLDYFALNPDRTGPNQSSGRLQQNDIYSWFTANYFTNVIAAARAANPNIRINIVTGGAPGSDTDLNGRLYNIATTPAKLNVFCTSLIGFIKQYNLDGWDLDWEFPVTTAEKNAQELMLQTVRAKFDSLGLVNCKKYEISIAVGGGYTNTTYYNPAHTQYLNANVINIVDFVNIMTYDGPVGGPQGYTSHQQFELMTAAFVDWKTSKSWTTSTATGKIALGVGFYGNGFGLFNAAGNVGTYYNNATYYPTGGSGCPNMQRKINYMKANTLAGIFIWELTMDNLGPGTVPTRYSLLDCIFQHTTANWGLSSNPASPCPLSVANIDLKAIQSEDVTVLKWNSQLDKASSRYVLFGSKNGVDFDAIQSFNQIETNNFNHVLTNGDSENSYFKVVQYGNEGLKVESNIISLDSNQRNEFHQGENPFIDEFSLKFLSPQSLDLAVLDLQGKQVYAETVVEKNELKVGRDLNPGVYILLLKSEVLTKSIKIVKQ